MRAPQFGKVWPSTMAKQTPPRAAAPEINPEAKLGLRVKPFANVFALVEGLGVISLHKTEAEAKTALEGEIERRHRFNERLPERVEPPSPEAGEPHEAEPDRHHRPS
jgi:hypothetical protein